MHSSTLRTAPRPTRQSGTSGKRTVSEIVPLGSAVFLSFAACFMFRLTYHVNSDASIGAIMGQDIASGNILLHNWFLSTQSYFTTDYLLSGLLYLLTGNLRLTGHFTAILIIILAFIGSAALWKRMARDAGSLQSLCIPFALFLIFLVALRNTVFNSPVHLATIAWCLLAAHFYFSKATARNNLLFVLFAALALIGDMYAAAYLILPLAAESVLYMLSTRKPDRHVLLILPACLLAWVVQWLLGKYGFTLPGIHSGLANLEDIPARMALFGSCLLNLFGAWFLEDGLSLQQQLVRLAFSVVPVACLAAHMAYVRSQTRVARFLCLSSAALSLAFIVSDIPLAIHTSRYLLGPACNGVILLSALAARRLHSPDILRVNLFALALSVLFLSAVSLQAPQKGKTDTLALAAALVDKKLQSGYAAYWSSYATVYAADGKVFIAAIAYGGTAGYTPLYWLCKTDWYHRPANFVVWDMQEPENQSGMNEQRLHTAFGNAKEEFIVNDRFKVFVYDYDLSKKLVNKS
jgi:hypothetical protein